MISVITVFLRAARFRFCIDRVQHCLEVQCSESPDLTLQAISRVHSKSSWSGRIDFKRHNSLLNEADQQKIAEVCVFIFVTELRRCLKGN